MKSIQKITEQIEDETGLKIVSSSSLSGGSISEAYKVITSDKTNYFLKVNNNTPDNFFQKEANGLIELQKASAIKIPEVILSADNFILTEFIQTGENSKNFFLRFGTQFAELHKVSNNSFGFFEDNFIGSNVQLNIPDANQKTDWTNFYFDKRLLFQIKLAEKNRLVDSELRSSFIQLEKRINNIIGQINESASLLHGDLWCGNFMITEEGNACLIDPAVYYGNREADIAMTKLFGGFSTDFYTSYNDAFPLAEDFQYRENIYKLYHVLNHLNLFGGSYYHQALSLIKFYLK